MYCSTSCPPQPSSQPPGDVHTASTALPIPCCCYWLSLAVLYLVIVGGCLVGLVGGLVGGWVVWWVGGWVGGLVDRWVDGWFVGWSVACLFAWKARWMSGWLCSGMGRLVACLLGRLVG